MESSRSCEANCSHVSINAVAGGRIDYGFGGPLGSGLHAGRSLALRAFSGCAARTGFQGPGAALRLHLALLEEGKCGRCCFANRPAPFLQLDCLALPQMKSSRWHTGGSE